MIYYSNEVDSHETLPLPNDTPDIIGSESEVGLVVFSFIGNSSGHSALPYSIINCWITPKQLEREEQIALVNEINRVFGIRGEII